MSPRKSQPDSLLQKAILTGSKLAQEQAQDSIRVRAGAEGSMNMGGMGGDAPRIPMMYLDPMMDPILMMFPQDNARERNRRIRHYYRYNPYIRSIIDFHTETPISDFDLRSPESEEVQDYYREYKEDIALFDVITDALREYWLLGESFHFGNWDESENRYDSFVQYPPEEIVISSAYTSSRKVFALRPNKDIAKLLQSTDASDQIVAEYMRTNNPRQVESIMGNQPFPLNEDRLIVLQRKESGYIPRGVSPLLAVIKDLLYEDFLNLYRNTFLQRHSFPLKIFKLGSENKGFIPNKKMFAEFRAQLISAISDPDYNLVTHPFVNVEYFSGHDKILQLIPYYELVKTRVFAGLFVSDAIVSGEKTPYAAGITFMKGLMNRYLTIRNSVELEIKRKVFLPIAAANGFYKPTPAEVSHKVKTRRDNKRLIIPDFFWKKANLLSNQSVMQMVIALRDKKEIPMQFVAEMMGWDLDDIIYQLKHEEGTRVDPKWRKAVDDAIAKDPNLAKKLILGDDLDAALKAQFKEQANKPAPEEAPKATPAKGRSKSEEFKLPETVGPSTVVAPEGGKHAPEVVAEKGPAAAPEGSLGERAARPSEQGGPGGPGTII